MAGNGTEDRGRGLALSSYSLRNASSGEQGTGKGDPGGFCGFRCRAHITTHGFYPVTFFWLSALLSIAVFYSGLIPATWAQEIPGVLFVVAVVAYSAITHYGVFLIPVAEEMRRKQLLSDAFDVPLVPERTSGYYNNTLMPSITRLGACVLENAFFGRSVCHEMAKQERTKIFIYGLLWLAAISYRSTALGIVLIVTQTLFSGEILVYWLKVEGLRFRLNKIYQELYSYFLHQRSSSQNLGIADILEAFASYESAKSAASIKQSSKIFHRLNPKLSEEWKDIREKLKIDQSPNRG